MTHPDLDRLTAWVHGFLEPGDAGVLEDHVRDCEDCRENADLLHEEARFVSREVAPSERMAALKSDLLRAARGGRRPGRGLVWQGLAAATVLVSLSGVLLWPRSEHRLVEGCVALEDGRVLLAPADLAASQAWTLRAVGKAGVLLSDRSTVELGPGARLSLVPGGARGVAPALESGEARFLVSPGSRKLSVGSPAGRVEAADGQFVMRMVSNEEGGGSMKNALAGAIVTVFAGSVSLANAEGALEARSGQSAVLARAEAPLLLLAPQDRQEELLRRLEELAARVAKVEEQVTTLELTNQNLKLQLATAGVRGVGGSAWKIAPGTPVQGANGLRAGQNPGPGGAVIELREDNPKKEDPKKAPSEK